MSAEPDLPPVHQTMLEGAARRPSRSPAEWDDLKNQKPPRAHRAYYRDVIRLPGYGRQPERCMSRKPVGFCNTHGHVALASASPCETRGCPEHSHLWRKGAAEKIVARLAAYRAAQSGAGRRLLHVVDSPDPERRWTATALWDGRRRSYDVLEGTGGRGGVAIPHPYRTSEQGDWLFREAVEHGEWEREAGRWSFLRDAADDWNEMVEFVEPSPHYHHLVAARDFNPDAIPSSRVVKNVRSLERFELRDMTGYRDMARTVMYLLSHAAYQPPGVDGGGRNTVTYWGDVHPNGFDPEEELTAAEWDTIQRMAEKAVRTVPSDDEGDGEALSDRPTCRVDGCEGAVIDISELVDYLNDEEWVASIDETQVYILEGAIGWLEELGDRPPPSTDRERIRQWLYQRGEKRRRFAPGRRSEQASVRRFA